MILSIHVNPESAAGLRGAGMDCAVGKLLSQYKLHAKPLFPPQTSLQTSQAGIFQVECPDSKAAEVLSALLKTPGVEGAYASPQEGLPDSP